jgi:hypothetical protein
MISIKDAMKPELWTDVTITYDGNNPVLNNIYNASSEPNHFIIEKGVIVEIGDFRIKSEDLGRLLEKLTKEKMPAILI